MVVVQVALSMVLPTARLGAQYRFWLAKSPIDPREEHHLVKPADLARVSALIETW
jgi:hypothetical protein